MLQTKVIETDTGGAILRKGCMVQFHVTGSE
jgi:hypothetical protein